MERNNKYISTEARILELFIGVFTVCSHQRACNFSTDSCKHCKHTDEKFWKASVLIYICSVVYFHVKCIYIYIYDCNPLSSVYFILFDRGLDGLTMAFLGKYAYIYLATAQSQYLMVIGRDDGLSNLVSLLQVGLSGEDAKNVLWLTWLYIILFDLHWSKSSPR